MGKLTFRKAVLAALGLLSLSLGITGIFLPILPTTPFLLLSAACFLRSSAALHQWLIGHRIFGSYIKAYLEHRAVTRRMKIVTLIMLWSVTGATALFVAESLWLKLLLAGVIIGVTIHIACLKTLK